MLQHSSAPVPYKSRETIFSAVGVILKGYK